MGFSTAPDAIRDDWTSRIRSAAIARRLWRGSVFPTRASRAYPRSEQLEDVMRGAHQRPFLPHLGPSASEELPEASGVFDLSEHRLHDHFAPAVHFPSSHRSKCARHPLPKRQPLGRPPARCRQKALPVLLPARGDIGLNPLFLEYRVSDFLKGILDERITSIL